MSDDPDTVNPSISFGQLLRHYRLTYHERFRKKYPEAPRVKMTALALIGCMTDAGHPITSGAYSEIENGESLPRESQRFVDTVSRCLLLDRDEYERLARQLAYDLVRTRIGEKTLEILLRHVQESNLADEVEDAEEVDVSRTP